MGSARGRWEGNTLVVETKNFNERGAYRNANPETYTLIERFTPVGPNKVEWSVTIDDPATWTKPWTYSMNLTRDASQPLFEYGCHEGNYGLAQHPERGAGGREGCERKGQIMRRGWPGGSEDPPLRGRAVLRDRRRACARCSRITRSPCSIRRSG